MNIIDIFVLIFILVGAIIGYKDGAIKSLVSFIGICVVTIIAFVLKDKLMLVMCDYLPFANFSGMVRGITSFNILLYQLIAFVVIFIALIFLLRVVIAVTGLVEWLVKKTVFLNFFSRVIGAVVSALKYYIFAFVILFVLNLPIFDIKVFQDSSVNNFILNNTPIISEYTNNTVNVYKNVYYILKNKKDKKNTEINTEVLFTLLDNELISIDTARELVHENKITIVDDSLLDDYKDSYLYRRLKDEIYVLVD